MQTLRRMYGNEYFTDFAQFALFIESESCNYSNAIIKFTLGMEPLI